MVMNAPDWLDPIAEQYWCRLTPSLEREGILNDATTELVAMACASYSTYRQARDDLKTQGRVTAKGRINPLCQVEKDALSQMVRVFKELKICGHPVAPATD